MLAFASRGVRMDRALRVGHLIIRNDKFVTQLPIHPATDALAGPIPGLATLAPTCGFARFGAQHLVFPRVVVMWVL